MPYLLIKILKIGFVARLHCQLSSQLLNSTITRLRLMKRNLAFFHSARCRRRIAFKMRGMAWV